MGKRRKHRLPRDERRSSRVQVLVTDEEYRRLERDAGDESVSTYVRKALISKGVM